MDKNNNHRGGYPSGSKAGLGGGSVNRDLDSLQNLNSSRGTTNQGRNLPAGGGKGKNPGVGRNPRGPRGGDSTFDDNDLDKYLDPEYNLNGGYRNLNFTSAAEEAAAAAGGRGGAQGGRGGVHGRGGAIHEDGSYGASNHS